MKLGEKFVNHDINDTYFIQMVRANELLKQIFGNILNTDLFTNLRRVLENMKKIDDKSVNK